MHPTAGPERGRISSPSLLGVDFDGRRGVVVVSYHLPMQYLEILPTLENGVNVGNVTVLFPIEQHINLFERLPFCLHPANLLVSFSSYM